MKGRGTKGKSLSPLYRNYRLIERIAEELTARLGRGIFQALFGTVSPFLRLLSRDCAGSACAIFGELAGDSSGTVRPIFRFRYVKTEDELPTIGIVLCHRKHDALVELTLPKDSNIFASKYLLYLPSKEELKKQLEEAAGIERPEDLNQEAKNP